MSMDNANEQDVREEIVTEFLSGLGYRRGTENDILREVSLSYGRSFLGRKKNSDPPLRGRADYILVVTGSARWVLEIKAPSEPIDQDAIEQAISYARHPGVSGVYAAVMNGKRLAIFHSSQTSTEPPIVDIAVVSGKQLANELAGLLTPSAIRRDCNPPVVDLATPLAEGLRSTAFVRRGLLSYSEFICEMNVPVPPVVQANFDEVSKKMRGLRSNITGGRVWRDDASRIKAKLDWTLPHDSMLQFVQDKRLLEIEYISLSSIVSSDATKPTIFDVVGNFNIVKGEQLFDILRWETTISGVSMSMNYRGQASGYMQKGSLVGNFQVEYEATMPSMPMLRTSMFGMGKFNVELEDR